MTIESLLQDLNILYSGAEGKDAALKNLVEFCEAVRTERDLRELEKIAYDKFIKQIIAEEFDRKDAGRGTPEDDRSC